QAQGELGRCEVRLTEASSRAQFIVEDVTREFSEAVDKLDWKQLMWRSDDEPPDMQTLDLEEEEDQPEGAAGPEGESPAESTEAAAPKRRRTAREPKGEATENALAALELTDWSAVKAEVDALRQRLNSMGAVNL